MNIGKHSAAKAARGRARPLRRVDIAYVLIAAALVISLIAAGSTIAYLVAGDTPVKNTFTPAKVDCEVTEEFDGKDKTDVNVQNTGDINAYVRVRLVTYRVDGDGTRIGGTAVIPAFTPGDGWVKYGDCYYYTEPVAPGEMPAADLIDSVTLETGYSDADGGRQVIEVIAEAIQSEPAEAIESSWGVRIENGTVSAAS